MEGFLSLTVLPEARAFLLEEAYRGLARCGASRSELRSMSKGRSKISRCVELWLTVVLLDWSEGDEVNGSLMNVGRALAVWAAGRARTYNGGY